MTLNFYTIGFLFCDFFFLCERFISVFFCLVHHGIVIVALILALEILIFYYFLPKRLSNHTYVSCHHPVIQFAVFGTIFFFY